MTDLWNCAFLCLDSSRKFLVQFMVPFSSPKVFDFWPLLHKGQIFFCSDWEYFWSAGSGWQIGILCQNLSFIGQLEPIRQHYPTKFSPFSTQTRAETFSPWGKKMVPWIGPKFFLDESTHKKAQFEKLVKYFTRIWTGLKYIQLLLVRLWHFIILRIQVNQMDCD